MAFATHGLGEPGSVGPGVQADNDMDCPHRMHGPDKRRTKSNCESPCPRFASPEEVGSAVSAVNSEQRTANSERGGEGVLVDIESQPHEAAPGAMQLGTTASGQPKRKDAPQKSEGSERRTASTGFSWEKAMPSWSLDAVRSKCGGLGSDLQGPVTEYSVVIRTGREPWAELPYLTKYTARLGMGTPGRWSLVAGSLRRSLACPGLGRLGRMLIGALQSGLSDLCDRWGMRP